MDNQTIPLDAARHLLTGLTVVGARDRAPLIADALRLWVDAEPLAEIATTVVDRPLSAEELRAAIVHAVGEQRAADLTVPCGDRKKATEAISERSIEVTKVRARERALAICKAVVEGQTGKLSPSAFLRDEMSKLSSSPRPRRGFANLVGAGMAHRVAVHAGKSGFRLDRAFFDDDTCDWIQKWVSPCGTMLPGGLCIMVGAASGGGKTTFSGGVLLSAAKAGMPVLVYQAELDHGDHAADLATQCAGIDRGSKPTDLVNIQVGAVAARLDAVVSYPSTDKKSLLETPSHLRVEVEAWLESLPARNDGNDCPGLIVVDYLQCLRDPESRAEWEGVDRIAQELADIAHKTRCVVVVLSQMTRGSQLAFAQAIVNAAAAADHQSFADLMEAAIETYGTTGMAGGDGVKRRADVAFVLGGVHGQRIVAIAKERGHAWGEDEAQDNRARLVTLRRNGRWERSKQSMAEFAAGLPKPVKHSGGSNSNHRTHRGPSSVDRTAKAEKDRQTKAGYEDLNRKLREQGGQAPSTTSPGTSATTSVGPDAPIDPLHPHRKQHRGRLFQ